MSLTTSKAAIVAGAGEGDVITFLNNSTVGWAFTPNSDIRVDAAGILDAGGRGLQGLHVVSIWEVLSQKRLASVSLDRLGFHRADETGNIFLPLGEPLTLFSGEEYVISTHITYIGEPFFNSRSGEVDFHPAITVEPGRRRVLGSDEDIFPADSSTFVGTVVGPNFRFTVIPEPSSLFLVPLSAAFLLMRCRGRRPER